MPSSALRSVALLAALLLAAAGCGPSGDDAKQANILPVPIADQEDAVCGMLIREQSAPRAQVYHDNGERAFFCSIGDLLVYLSAPSPHGPVRYAFVEVMTPDEDPLESHTSKHGWRHAEDAVYVIGVDRPGIMGAPVLVYADDREAQQVVEANPGARIVDVDGLTEWWTKTHGQTRH